MKTNGTRFGKRLFTFLLAISIVALVTIPSATSSAETPQGRGGEVVAKPTPTKSRPTGKAPARSTGRVVSLEGTVWEVKDTQGAENPYEFLAGGKLKYGKGGTADWKQSGTRIVMTFGGVGTVESGTISGNRMNGTGRMVNGTTYRWSAKRKR